MPQINEKQKNSAINSPLIELLPFLINNDNILDIIEYSDLRYEIKLI